MKFTAKIRIVAFGALLAMLSLATLSTGCSEDTKAKKLYLAGSLADVISLYPRSSWADSARNAGASRLYMEGRFIDVLREYPNCVEWGRKTRSAIATQLLQSQKYDDLLRLYPGSSAADTVREIRAQELLKGKKYEAVIELYPRSHVADTVRLRHPEVEKKLQADQAKLTKQIAQQRRALCRSQPSNCLRIGMSQASVTELIGQPDDINRSVFAIPGGQRTHEQWVYESYSYHSAYVYFEDGILTSWQE